MRMKLFQVDKLNNIRVFCTAAITITSLKEWVGKEDSFSLICKFTFTPKGKHKYSIKASSSELSQFRLQDKYSATPLSGICKAYLGCG